MTADLHTAYEGVPPRPPFRRPARWHAAAWAAAKLLLFAAVSVAVVVGAYRLFDRNNQQPTFYHPDEPGKVGQLLRPERNFNHPQLMLETALLWMRWHETPANDPDAALAAGRSASAALAAGAVLMLAWAGFAAAGWTGFVLVAITGGLCPALLAHARYLKEEPSLAFGFAAVLCVGAILCRRRWHWTITLVLAALLGAACGLAASGKYAGAVTLGPALLLAIAKTWRRWWLVLPVPLLVCVGAAYAWSLINYRALENWEEFRAGFESERQHGVTAHGDVTMAQPNTFFVDALLTDAMPHVLWLAAVTPIAVLLQRRRGRRGRLPTAWLFVVLLGGTYLAALCWSVIPFFRYVLPVTLALYALAGMSAAWLVHAMGAPRPVHAAAVFAVAGALVYVQGRRVEDYDRQFASDSRDALRNWVNTSVPAGTRIAADGYTELVGRFGPAGHTTRAQVYRGRSAADLGTIRYLRGLGVKYVAVAGPTYERYLDPHTLPEADAQGRQSRFERSRLFYTELFHRYPVVWSRVARHKMRVFTNPDITVYRIDEPPAARK
jgi:hypothetical protein